MKNEIIILGAGITGLTAGLISQKEIYEANNIAGGICASYYLSQKGTKTYLGKEKAYRFELGGGHWIFGTDKRIKDFIDRLSPTKTYTRNSAVYFPDLDLYVPYPLQNNLSYLPESVREKSIKEICNSKKYKKINTLEDWLEINFGKTLCELFFFPFHNLYTAGLYTKIAPEDEYKTPLDKKLMINGAKTNYPIGYNATFIYPKDGLDDLVMKMAKHCKINFCKKIVKINLKKKEVLSNDCAQVKYEKIFSTIPLNRIIDMANLNIKKIPLPYTSVLVVNIGAKKGEKCPPYHWIYTPKNKAGFYRVGFYSNVDSSFLPLSSEGNSDRVSIYVEKAYRGRDKGSNNIDIKNIGDKIIKELREWRFITEVEVIDYNWIEVAYTWEYPSFSYRQKAMKILRKNQIYQIGRYGKWRFQGIAGSIEDGLNLDL